MAMICISGCRECDGCMRCAPGGTAVATPAELGGTHYRGRNGCALPSDRLRPEELALCCGPVTVWRRYR